MNTPASPSDDRYLPTWLNILGLLGICAGLGVAFYYQLVLFDLPCPLCLLQRVGMILIGMGFFLNLRLGIRNIHYGLALIGSVTTAAIGMRQVLLHIRPDDAGYGEVFVGLHFYTWAVLASVVAILGIAVMLMLESRASVTRPRGPDAFTTGMARVALGVFVLLIAGNLVSTLLECGPGACADDPVSYEWLRARP